MRFYPDVTLLVKGILLMNIERHKPVTHKRRKPWTMEELRFVELHYGSLLVCEIAEHLGRTSGSVKSMAHRLGCNGTHLHWTDDDKAVLTTHYATGAKMQTVMSMLPGRTWAGIMSMIDRMGIVRRQWQPQECRILEKYYASEGLVLLNACRAEQYRRWQIRLML